MADVEEEVFGDGSVTPEEGQPQTSDEKDWTTVAGGERQEEDPSEQPNQKPQESEDQVRERLKAVQQKYQAMCDAMKTTAPTQYNQFQEQWRQSLKNDPIPEPEQKVTPGEPGIYGDDDLLKLIDNRFTSFEKRIYQREEQARQQQMQAVFDQEYARADKALTTFIVESKLSREEVEEIRQSIINDNPHVNYNTINGPTAYVKAFGKEVMIRDLMKKPQEHLLQIKSDAERRALQAKLASQPESASIGIGTKRELTNEEKILESMKNIGSNTASDEVFG